MINFDEKTFANLHFLNLRYKKTRVLMLHYLVALFR